MAANDNEKDRDEEGQESAKKGLLSNRWVLLGVALVFVVALSTGLTVLVFGPDEPLSASMGEEMVAKSDSEKRIKQLEEQLATQSQKLAELHTRLESVEATSSIRLTQEMLIAQEQSFVAFLEALKEGMKDIAHMVRGSRDWLELYEARLNEVIEQSQGRIVKIQQWAPQGTAAAGSQTTTAEEPATP